MATLEFGQVVMDCRRADELGGFWSALLRRPLEAGADAFHASLPGAPERGFPTIMFLQVPEPRAGKNRLHLVLFAADHEAAAERAVTLGRPGWVFDIGAAHA